MLIATAGHIDHGKTSLVRALTGVETDRLPEERARGISIDLGFAYWRYSQGVIGFVDVPGHERFVRNMLAGVGGIDFALLVIAADDGVMPQTIEHTQILDLLRITRGAVALTKCDRVSDGRRAEVSAQVRTLLSRTGLVGAPIFEVSAVTGEGLAHLAAALRASDAEMQRRGTDGLGVRLAVDRAFTVSGAGTVVTGTILDGVLDAGARLVLSPQGLEARVRGLQSAGRAVTRARAGERCAVNLGNVGVGQIRRGDWLLAPDLHAPATRMDVRLRVLRNRSEPLKHNAAVHLHIGTADIGARVLLPEQRSLPAGTEAIVQLVLDEATHAATGDRFVLRDQSGQHTVGGGHVIDPFAPVRRRKDAALRDRVTAALGMDGPLDALAALLAIPGYEVDTEHFRRCFKLDGKAVLQLHRQLGAVLIGGVASRAVAAARLAEASAEILAALGAFHRESPDADGMPTSEIRGQLSVSLSEETFDAVMRELADRRVIETAGPYAKLAGHVAVLSPADRALWRAILTFLETRTATPFTIAELTRELRGSDTAVKLLLLRKTRHGEVWRMEGGRFLLREQAALLATQAAKVSETSDNGFTAADYRDATGIGRNAVIRVLEFLDSIGVTRRNGDVRSVRPGYERIVGSG